MHWSHLKKKKITHTWTLSSHQRRVVAATTNTVRVRQPWGPGCLVCTAVAPMLHGDSLQTLPAIPPSTSQHAHPFLGSQNGEGRVNHEHEGQAAWCAQLWPLCSMMAAHKPCLPSLLPPPHPTRPTPACSPCPWIPEWWRPCRPWTWGPGRLVCTALAPMLHDGSPQTLPAIPPSTPPPPHPHQHAHPVLGSQNGGGRVDHEHEGQAAWCAQLWPLCSMMAAHKPCLPSLLPHPPPHPTPTSMLTLSLDPRMVEAVSTMNMRARPPGVHSSGPYAPWRQPTNPACHPSFHPPPTPPTPACSPCPWIPEWWRPCRPWTWGPGRLVCTALAPMLHDGSPQTLPAIPPSTPPPPPDPHQHAHPVLGSQNGGGRVDHEHEGQAAWCAQLWPLCSMTAAHKPCLPSLLPPPPPTRPPPACSPCPWIPEWWRPCRPWTWGPGCLACTAPSPRGPWWRPERPPGFVCPCPAACWTSLRSSQMDLPSAELVF